MKNLMVIFLAALTLVLCGSVQAATLNVPSTEYPTIQSAVDAAVYGDTVQVAAGTYTENLVWDTKSILLIGAGANVTTVNGGGTDSCLVMTDVPDTARVEGFTFTGGSAPEGGGMYLSYSNPTVTDCTFSENSALGTGWLQGGGGIYNESSSPIVTNCTFSENSADHEGGGMYNYSSSPTVTDCTFSSNHATDRGGGLYSKYDNPTVTNCTFSENSTDKYGGGMYNDGGNTTVTNCTFSENSTDKYGGGMYNYSGSPTVTNCMFSGNTASRGGGMYNYSSPTVTNCTFSGNTAYYGGGMYSKYGNQTVTNCTFSENSVDNYGGGIYNESSSSIVTNCIMWGNTAADGDEIYNESSSTPTISYSDIAGCGGSGSDWNASLGADGSGNIDADPLFVNAPADLYLLPGSPCIDAGDNSALPSGVTTDLDGNPRITNSVVDMGAFEVLPLVDLLLQLAQDVVDLNIEHGVINGLDAKLGAALGALDDLKENNDVAAINTLEAFIHVVEHQSGNVIGVEDAAALIAAAQRIIDILNAQ